MGKFKMPRLRKGKYFVGPDYYGCINTGFAPCIRYTTLTDPPILLVGHESDVLDTETLKRAFFSRKRTVQGRITDRKVYVYHTTRAARKRFIAMCEEARAENREEAKRVAELRRRAKAGDFGSVLTLGIDYGESA